MSGITNEMYSKLPNLVLGFHGCNEETFKMVIKQRNHLKPSENDYDWLGHGIYFWENSYERAYDWAKAKYHEHAKVIGAILDLGYCLNMTDYKSSEILKTGFELLKTFHDLSGKELPQNCKGRSKTDVLLRNLDCAVIQQIHEYNKRKGFEEYDSIRGVFTEGGEVYPGAAFVEKTHTQICIVNPNCIKGYFEPMQRDKEYKIP